MMGFNELLNQNEWALQGVVTLDRPGAQLRTPSPFVAL